MVNIRFNHQFAVIGNRIDMINQFKAILVIYSRQISQVVEPVFITNFSEKFRQDLKGHFNPGKNSSSRTSI